MPYGYGGYGGGGSVGGSAAAGLASGFDLGLRSDAAQDRRAQVARENARQDALDAQRADQIARTNKRQDVQDADTEQDRGLNAVSQEMEDNRIRLAGLAQQYGSPDKIPQSIVAPLIAQAQDISQRRTALLNQKYAPIVQREQQWAADTASRIQTGQISMDDLSPADTVRLIQAQTRRPVTDFIRPATDPNAPPGTPPPNSLVGQAVKDTTAGVQTGNGGLTTQGAGVLLAPDINIGTGHIAPDGSVITGKSLSALVPAPQTPSAAPPVPPLAGLSAALGAATSMPVSPTGPQAPGGMTGAQADAGTPPDNGMGGAPDTPAAATPGQPQPAPAPTPMQALTAPGLQPPAPPPPAPPPPPPLAPGTDPNKVIPVLQVTAEHPDGTQVSYHAPVTVNRSADPNDPIHPGISISDSMQRMGQLGTLEAWANTPQAKAKITQGIADLGGGVNDFTSAYGAMHGDPKALLPVGSTDPTTLKIQAYTKAAAAAGMPLGDYVRMIEGKTAPATGLVAQTDQLHTLAVKDGMSDADEAKKLQGMGVLRSPPAGPSAKADKPPANYKWSDPDDHSKGVSPIKGGPADPDVKNAGGMGGREGIYTSRVLNAAGETAADLGNIVRLPITASAGIFGGRTQGPSLIDAGREALTNTLTTQEVQSFNTRASGFQRNLAAIEAAGLAPSGTLSHQMDVLKLAAGDSYQTKMEKLAQIRQITDVGLETIMANPKLSGPQRDLARTVLGRIHTAVPFTIADVDQLQNLQVDNPDATLSDVIKDNGLNKSDGTSGSGGAPAGNIPQVTDQASYDAVPSGSLYQPPSGPPKIKR